ncbi:cytochrome c oxidase assembly protein [Rhizobium halophilum]|uniref:cytochrome c oxidase assembly protein n=1 Tax=Rhizobium halophilum TaxID=2846852 RepID=UPI001EFC571F|nr:cytochrome c oxidase assembly protein [Rhizobium halophilum]MCF6369886.1 cytochrome c oxidase assembly protein [Rhizobium halophilum]
MLRFFFFFLAFTCLSRPAAAHSGAHPEMASWSFEPFAMTPIVVAACLYALGLARMRAHAGAHVAAGPVKIALFSSGLLLAALFLVSPLDSFAERFLSAHMVQHFGLMLIAAPLIALGSPGIIYIWALPKSARLRFARARGSAVGRLGRAFFTPFGAWVVYFLVLWLWHSPPLFGQAVAHEPVHALQHLSFLGAALLFWTVVTQGSRGEERAAMFVVIFATAVQSCALAALMTLSSIHWYPFYTEGSLGLSAFEDQQLAGLIMWVPCCAIMIGAGVATMARLLRDVETRMHQAGRQ